MDLNTRKILSLFASILFTIPVYIILHEGGHALIALSCGARITEFSILGAYMRYEGGTFTALTLSLFYIAGMLLPISIPAMPPTSPKKIGTAKLRISMASKSCTAATARPPKMPRTR